MEGIEIVNFIDRNIAGLHNKLVARSCYGIAAVELARNGCTITTVIRTERERIIRRSSCGRSIACVDIAEHLAARDVDLVPRDTTRAR